MKIPPWIEVARSAIGITETPGEGNNPKILAWAKMIGGDVQHSYVADSIPWCGLFVAHCLAEAGIQPVAAPLWALNWSKFGVKLKSPLFGCIGTKERNGGGHVFFCVSQDDDYIHALGGNQSDQVNVTKILKSDIVSYNWPIGFEDDWRSPLPHKKFDGKLTTSFA